MVGEEGFREERVLEAGCGGDERVEGGAEVSNHGFQGYCDCVVDITGSGSGAGRCGCFWCSD